MRLHDVLEHPLLHSDYLITVDQHHIRPYNLQASNTTLSVAPLPGGPGVWDISVHVDTLAALFSLRSIHTSAEGVANSGITGIAFRQQLHTTVFSFGGQGNLGVSSYNAVYSKPGGSTQLSHKIFDSAGDFIALTDAWLFLTSPTTRVLRTYWTNYGSSYKTLNCWGEIAIMG